MLLNSAAPSHNAESLKGIKHLVISKHENKYFQGRLKERLGMHVDYSLDDEKAKAHDVHVARGESAGKNANGIGEPGRR